MHIISHHDVPKKNGYYSKVTESRNIVTPKIGATSFSLYEQTLPLDGYIVAHYHDYEESLTFLSGRVQIVLDGETFTAEARATVFIPPQTVHSVRNVGNFPALLIAVHGTSNPRVLYPDGPPNPVRWGP